MGKTQFAEKGLSLALWGKEKINSLSSVQGPCRQAERMEKPGRCREFLSTGPIGSHFGDGVGVCGVFYIVGCCTSSSRCEVGIPVEVHRVPEKGSPPIHCLWFWQRWAAGKTCMVYCVLRTFGGSLLGEEASTRREGASSCVAAHQETNGNASPSVTKCDRWPSASLPSPHQDISTPKARTTCKDPHDIPKKKTAKKKKKKKL